MARYLLRFMLAYNINHLPLTESETCVLLGLMKVTLNIKHESIRNYVSALRNVYKELGVPSLAEL